MFSLQKQPLLLVVHLPQYEGVHHIEGPPTWGSEDGLTHFLGTVWLILLSSWEGVVRGKYPTLTTGLQEASHFILPHRNNQKLTCSELPLSSLSLRQYSIFLNLYYCFRSTS